MTIVTFGQYSFDTEALRGRGFLTPYVIDGVTYELETAIRVAAALDMAAKVAEVGSTAGTIAAAQSTVSMIWDAATTATDPGAGKLRATTASPAVGSYNLLVSTTDSAGVDIGSMLAAMGTSSSAIKARARLVKVGDASKYVDLQVTSVSGAGAYRTVAVTCVGGPGGFGAV